MSKLFTSRDPLQLSWVAIMNHTRHDRALEPSRWQTRCIRAGEVHEFINVGLAVSYPVDHVEYYGFAVFNTSGVLAVGDSLIGEGITFGVISGFDETHQPNHYNILVEGPTMQNGHALDLKAGMSLRTRPRENIDSGES